MTHHPEKLKAELRGIDPTKPFYLAISVTNIDGSIEPAGAEPIEGAALDPASLVEIARELADEHGSECYIYRCVPIRRVYRGKVRSVDL